MMVSVGRGAWHAGQEMPVGEQRAWDSKRPLKGKDCLQERERQRSVSGWQSLKRILSGI